MSIIPKVVREYRRLLSNKKYDDAYEISCTIPYRLFQKEFLKQIKCNKKYYSMLTFTVDPKKFTLDTIKDIEQDIENYIVSSLINRKDTLHVLRCDYVKERCQSGYPHWHVAFESDVCLKKDRFNYYEKKYGHINRSKSKHKSYHTIINYISKDTLPTSIV